MQILVVDDESVSRSLLENLVSRLGHQVVVAENGLQAWQVIQDSSVRIVISDWLMPGMDGLDLCSRVRRASLDRYVYMIVITAKTGQQELVRVLESGADDYIPKPFNPDELKARIETGIRIIRLEEDHLRLQRYLIESRNKLSVVFDALEEQIAVLNGDFEMVSANSAFARAVRHPFDEIIDRCLLHLPAALDNLGMPGKDVRELIGSVMDQGRTCKKTISRVAANGNETYKEVQFLPVKDKNDQVAQVVMVIKDLSEERRKSRQIQALNQQLLRTSAKIEQKNEKLESALKRLSQTQAQMVQSEKMASIGQLAAGVAHEINNPTGFVSSNLKTLSDYQQSFNELFRQFDAILVNMSALEDHAPLPPALRSACEAIRVFKEKNDIAFLMEDVVTLINECREGVDRIKKIVSDMKDFAHPGEDEVQHVDINAGLDSTLNMVNNEIKYKAKVFGDFADIPPVLGYPRQLNQVFMNILVNAAQAIQEQGEIHIRTESCNGAVRVRIRDTGCGIAPDHIGKVFDPFFTTKEVGKGTGLGMNIAYNIVKKHNGTIEVESKVGEGTTFTVTIPAKTDC